MKKIISILVIVLLTAGMAIGAFAADTTAITVEKTAANRGEEVTLEVTMANNPGFSAAKFTVTYDVDVLTLVGVDTQDYLLAGAAENDEKGVIAFASATNITDDGVLFTITFKVNENAADGDYGVSVTISKLINSDREAIAHTINAGVVTIADGCNHAETLVHKEAVTPTCKAEGNLEYWYCSACQQLWKDAALTQPTDLKNVALPMADHVDADKNDVCDVCDEGLSNPDVGAPVYVAVAVVLVAVIGIVVLIKKRAS